MLNGTHSISPSDPLPVAIARPCPRHDPIAVGSTVALKLSTVINRKEEHAPKAAYPIVATDSGITIRSSRVQAKNA